MFRFIRSCGHVQLLAYTPGYPEVMKQFNVCATVALLGLSLYAVGLAFGPVLATPISETKGRRVVYLVTHPLAAIFTLGAGFWNNIESLLVTRFFAAFFWISCVGSRRGYESEYLASNQPCSCYECLSFRTIPGASYWPGSWGFPAQYKGWRWTQWTILFIMLPSYLSALGMKETYKKFILQKRAQKLGIPPPPKMGPSGLAGMRVLNHCHPL